MLQEKIKLNELFTLRHHLLMAIIRDFRAPDHYKGKGIRYVDEYVRLKAGKTA